MSNLVLPEVAPSMDRSDLSSLIVDEMYLLKAKIGKQCYVATWDGKNMLDRDGSLAVFLAKSETIFDHFQVFKL